MILSNVEMQRAMDEGRLVIDPRPLPLRPTEGQKCPYDTHTVNLRLGQEISIPETGPFSFDLLQGGSLSTFLSRNSERMVIPRGGLPLERLQFVLGMTVEYLSLPVDHPVNRQT
jgi:deoxycytidine triphosphate deaminase